MGIRPFFKFVPGDKVVIAAFIVSAMAHRAVEQHFTAAAGRLGNGDIKAAVLPHSDQAALSRYGNKNQTVIYLYSFILPSCTEI